MVEPSKHAKMPIGRLNAIWNSVKKRASVSFSVVHIISVTRNIHVNVRIDSHDHDYFLCICSAAPMVCTLVLFITTLKIFLFLVYLHSGEVVTINKPRQYIHMHAKFTVIVKVHKNSTKI